MKKSILFVTGLCVLAAGCAKKTPPVAQGGQPQIQAPVPPPPPPPAKQVQQAKAEPVKQAPPAKQTPPPAKPAKMPDSVKADLNGLLAKLSDAFFDYNQATIRTDATTALNDNATVIRDILKDYPAEKLLIEGHADDRGSSEYNLGLADRRARAANEFLSSRGIPQTQLSVLSLGEERPVCTDATEACYQKNRRIHITVAP